MKSLSPSLPPPRESRSRGNGSALVITMMILVLVTVLAVGMMSLTRLERASARNTLDSVQARNFSDMAADHALALLRDAVTAAEATAPAASAGGHKFWASQPGRITVFNADGTMDAADSRDLFSSAAAGEPSFDLNQAMFGGKHPILPAQGNAAAPTMAVQYVNVLKNPAGAATQANPIMGRYAFWVDDESTKINLSTADGTQQGLTNSYGAGMPTEVNLQALTKGGVGIPSSLAVEISGRNGMFWQAGGVGRPFNLADEILQLAGVDTTLYEENRGDLTHFNRSPDQNIWGEPKIYLASETTQAVPRYVGIGPYPAINPSPASTPASGSLPGVQANSQPLTWIYPSSGTNAATSQLPFFKYTAYGSPTNTTVRLPQIFHDDNISYGQGIPLSEADYDLGMRIARYLKGFDSQGNPVQWPQFPGSASTGFAGKYTDRQIDELTLQMMSLLKQLYPDHFYGFTIPYLMPKGFLSGKPVRGLSRSPRFTEVLLQVTTAAGNPPSVSMTLTLECYLPKEFKGYNLSFGDVPSWTLAVNPRDIPGMNKVAQTVTGPSTLGSYWEDQSLTLADQNGQPAGADLFGNDPRVSDPDQAKAALYHDPWALKDSSKPYDAATNPYMGTAPNGYGVYAWRPIFSTGPLANSVYSPGKITRNSAGLASWNLGDYHSCVSVSGAVAYPMKKGTTQVTVGGGFSVALYDGSGSLVEMVPIDGLHPIAGESINDPGVRQTVLDAVIPIPGTTAQRTIPVPGRATFHMQVADPFVNNFPGDWVGSVNPAGSEITLGSQLASSTDPDIYQGRNTTAQPANGGDPQVAWWPEQNAAIPKSQRFPSAGYLQYLHTGLMPDKASDSLPLPQQKGTPYRLLNFSPSTAASQQTAGGDSYPDWALLDLFTTPAVFQPVNAAQAPPVCLTWGGATSGRINPNAVLVPFGITRVRPLEALFKGLQVATSYDGSGNPQFAPVDEIALATAVEAYIAGLGRPLMLPGEICNVPAVAADVYAGVASASRSRNDLVRQVVGNLSTRSNTFAVWTVGEVIQKKPGNVHYGEFEDGDLILGRSRMKYLVERYLDPGTDGVYGNAASKGGDGVLNTPDDPVTISPGAHPVMTYPLPYKYRIVSVVPVTE